MANRKVLIITYLFPPSGGIGPPRYVAYTRYLPDYGCDVSVLTAKWPATPLYDPALGKKVPPQTKVYRAINPEVPYQFRDRIWKKLKPAPVAGEAAAAQPSGGNGASGGGSLLLRPAKAAVRKTIEILFQPDVQKFWVPFALRKAEQIIRDEKIDAVILNTPPFSLFGIIAPLKKKFPHLLWITEIRDDWVGYYLENFDTAKVDKKRDMAIRLEGEGIRASDFVIPVTPAQTAAVRNRYPDQPDSKFLCVPNGYDGELFENFQRRPSGSDRMVITYFGSVYASPPYSPVAFLKALDELPEEIRNGIEVRFIGRVVVEAQPLFENRKANIQLLGFKPRDEGTRLLQETDYLLVIVNDPTAYAGKMFDYLGTGIPILALTPPEGQTAALIRETRTGMIAEGRDPAAVRQILLDAWERHRKGETRLHQPDWDLVRGYERRNLVRRFVELTGISDKRV